MKYREVDIKKARKCCTDHHKNCEICPLERTTKDKNGKIHHLFCWFVLMKLHEACKPLTEEAKALYEEDYNELINMDLCDNEAWLNYLLESEE